MCTRIPRRTPSAKSRELIEAATTRLKQIVINTPKVKLIRDVEHSHIIKIAKPFFTSNRSWKMLVCILENHIFLCAPYTFRSM